METSADVMVRVKAIYEQRFRSLLETEENLGKFLTVDIHSGDYELSDDIIQNIMRLRERHAEVRTGTLRVGYPAAFTRGTRMRPNGK